jgi:hypothetical protein
MVLWLYGHLPSTWQFCPHNVCFTDEVSAHVPFRAFMIQADLISVRAVNGTNLHLAGTYHRVVFAEPKKRIDGGGQIWQRLSQQNAIDFVLCHPGGWGLQEQSLLHRAMVKAGLVASAQMATERVKFVGEAEASVHYVMFHADLQSRLRVSLLHRSASELYSHSLTQPGIDFAVCNAGGSTVDTTLYTVSSMTPSLTLRERRDSACGSFKYSLLDVFTSYVVTLGIQAGGIFVDRSAAKYFRKKFYDADLDPDQVTELQHRSLSQRSSRLFEIIQEISLLR